MPSRPFFFRVTTRLIASIVAVSVLLSCAQIPDFAPEVASTTPYPEIVPASDIEAQVANAPSRAAVEEAEIEDLAQDANDLRARADALRNLEVIDDTTAADMQTGVDQ
jgi:hypothetical protein